MTHLQLDPEQFLSLYNLLNSQLGEFEDTTRGRQDLLEIRDKMTSFILDSLRNKSISQNQDVFNVWIEKERKKLSTLEKDLESLRTSRPAIDHDDGLIFRPEPEQNSGKKVANKQR